MSSDDRRILHCGERAGDSARRRLAHPCPMRWGELESTGEATVRYCSRCDHLVHKVANVFEARARARQGECLAVPPSIHAHVVANVGPEPQGLVIGFWDEGAFLDEMLTDPEP